MISSIIQINNISTEKLKCPNCSESNETNNSNINFNINNPSEFDKIICKSCSFEFCFIICEYCSRRIYMKINQDNSLYNGMNAFNIACPYKLCEKIFYFTECVKCKRTQKHKKYIKEGEIIKCLYDDCQFEYIQNNCSILHCNDLVNIAKKLMTTNFPEGILSNHLNKYLIQKINCFYCWRPIVYLSSKMHKNKYYECQLVECPYKDCKKKFNRIICPFCFNEIYVQDGWYEMGSEIKCKKCNNFFGKILCPSCGKMNECKDNYFQFGKMVCGFQNCQRHNYMINCIFCRKLNIFNKEKPINGQLIKCGYCQNEFNEILCPFCKMIIPFPSADFSFGKVYKCIYISCLKVFQFLICPNCSSYSFKSDSQEGKKLNCQNCKTKFMNWGCPFCKCITMDKDTSLKLGQLVKCPNKSCQKIYSFIRCSKCEKLIFSKENENIIGISVKCPHKSCGVYTLVSFCSFCGTKAIYSDSKKNYNDDDLIKCPSPTCNKEYTFQRDKDIYFNKLSILEKIEGNVIRFGIAQVDENFLYKQELFTDKRCIQINRLFPTQYSSESIVEQKIKREILENKYFDECMICRNNRKESIFFPCGHRCVCYNCAVLFFSVYHKCPKCQCKAKCIIKKVYD